ncbi:MAG TPA: hypothetical protein DHU63_12515 [Candidatus Marinimicrobia bacterium]|nr:hypothetical protein [Candidatus Neomarinimicrobiota bacterium]
MNGTSLLTDPIAILVYLLGLIAVIYWAHNQPKLARIFKYLPTVIWIYFLPMFSTTLGITPENSPLYDFVKLYLLPAALILLLLSSNTRELVKLGPKAMGTMLFGTLGIVVGGVVALAIFGHWLPADAWKGMGALSGSWIGGSSNMVAIGTSIGTRDDLFGIMIIVDTVVGYGWMGVVIFLSGFQERIDKWNGVDSSHIDEMDQRMQTVGLEKRRPLTFKDLSLMVFIGLGLGYFSLQAGYVLPDIGSVITSFAWTIIIVSIIGLGLSLTKLSELENAGASHVGNIFLYLLLATIGAKADLQAITQAPLFLVVGVVWILIHAVILFFGGKLLKAPMFLIATSSQANVGGVVSAPIVASVYRKSLAPVGLLMGVVGNVLGIYFGLLAAQLMSWVASLYF